MNHPSASKKALLIYGGWEGHHPEAFAKDLAEALDARGLTTDLESDLQCLEDGQSLQAYDLIIPFWTMGELSKSATTALQSAVLAGTGLAGIHGGMGDAFRGNLDYEWMVGGHFVGHPYVGDYTVTITDHDHPITRDLPDHFAYQSEQYYLLVDPDVHLLATTDYLFQGRTVKMPVAWTRQWGSGRVFYSALGHHPDEYRQVAAAAGLAFNGMLWACQAGQV